jgi:myo-inositol 2-dehydrogenase / D-chiro-inositol 1-dehydrogenase
MPLRRSRWLRSFNPELLGDVDTMLVNMRFASGLVGSLSYSVGAPESHESPLTVYGSKGRMTVEREQIVVTKPDAERVVTVPAHDPFVEEFRDFYDAVVNGKELAVQPEELLDDLRFVEAALQSSQENRPVPLKS